MARGRFVAGAKLQCKVNGFFSPPPSLPGDLQRGTIDRLATWVHREGKSGSSFFGQVAKEGKGGEASGLFGGSPKKCRLVNNIREAEGRGRSYLRPGEDSWPSPFLSISGRSLPSRGPGALEV